MDAIFPGLSAMENVHPLFVHFPVVLLPLALIVQALAAWRGRDDWQQAALWLLYLGTAGAILAVLTGRQAEEHVFVPEPAWEVIELHENLMYVTTGLAVALSAAALALRRRMTRKVQALLLVGLLVLTTVLVVGADRGGQLVYQYGVSVQKP